MKKLNLLYHPKTYFIKIKDQTYEFFSFEELDEFLKRVDLSKYKFQAGVK